MDKRLLADLLTAQEAESRRRMTHQLQTPNPYLKGAEDMVNRWWTGVVDRTGQIAEGVENFPQEIGQLFDPAYMDTIKPPDFQQGLDLAMDLSGGAPSIAATFGGISAKTANKAALLTAQDMAAKGASREAIWEATGWFKGPEGKWKFEIDDSKARLNPKGWEEGAGGTQWGAGMEMTPELGLKHSALYKAYPDIREGPTLDRLVYGPGRSQMGSYSPETRFIRAESETPEGMKSNLLHELQHDIQTQHGFATGGNPAQDMPEAVAASQDFVKRAQALMAKEPNARQLDGLMEAVTTGKIDGPTFEREYERVVNSFKHGEEIKRLNEAAGTILRSPQEAYRRLAGEAEARNVQTRMDWTPEQRRATPPWKSLDVPEDELIVSHQQGLANALERQPIEEITPEMRQARAREQGYIGPFYHGTKHAPEEKTGIEQFDPGRIGEKTDMGWYGRGHYLTGDPNLASKYGGTYKESFDPYKSQGGTVYPLMARIGNPLPITKVSGTGRSADSARTASGTALKDKLLELKGWTVREKKAISEAHPITFNDTALRSIKPERFTEVLKRNGYDGVIVNKVDTIHPERSHPQHEIVSFDPNQIRSVHANFDPLKQESSDLLASLLLGGVGLPLMSETAQNPEQAD